MFFFGNWATGHFMRKFLSKIAGSDHASSNNTSLKSVSGPGDEYIELRQTEFGYYNID
jgi:hypothetical protein